MAEKEARVQSGAANDPSALIITEKAPTRAFSWLKEPTSAFTLGCPKVGIWSVCKLAS